MAHLPVSRTKTIMRTTDGADNVSKEAVLLATRAAELFIKELALEALKDVKKDEKKMNYINLVNVVHSKKKYEFLEYMIPKKITVKEFKAMMEKKKMESTSDSSEEASSSSESESESDSTDEKPSVEGVES